MPLVWATAGPVPRPVAHWTWADGTAYVGSTNGRRLVVGRQAVTPRAAGADVADVSAPDTITVRGGPFPSGFVMVWKPGPWWPQAEASVWGWYRLGGGGGATCVGPYRAGRAAFRVSFQRVSLPVPFLAALAPMAALPPVTGAVRRRARRRGFAVPGPVGGRPLAAADVNREDARARRADEVA